MEPQADSRPARPLKVGLILPVTERQMDGGSARWRDLKAMALFAEEVGVDSLWITDHLIYRAPGQETRGMWECWSLIAALAASTRKPEIGSIVLCSSFRHPALLAKMADTVDEISGGRLIVGIGSGWVPLEHHAFGYPFDHRTDRFAEALPILSGLLRDGHIDFQCQYYAVRDCAMRPRGPRPKGPPIVVGASSAGPRMLDLAARYADGWNAWFSSTGNTVEGLLPLLARVDAACEAVGRDPATLSRSAAVVVEAGAPGPSARNRPRLSGGSAAIADSLRAHAEAGLSHVQVWLEPNTLAGIEAFARVLEDLDRA